MSASQRTQKRRAEDMNPSTTQRASRETRISRKSQSLMGSGSRQTTVSRRSSAESLRGRGSRRPSASASTQSVTFDRGQSIAPGDGSTGTEPELLIAQGNAPEFDHDIDMLREIVMAVSMSDAGTVGCAYYVASQEKLYFMEDAKSGSVENVDALRLFINPTVIIVSTKCAEEIFDRLDPGHREGRCSDDGRNNDQTRLPYLLECRPAAEFGYESARTKLVNLRLGQQGGPRVTFVVPGDIVPEEENYNVDESRYLGKQGQLLRLSGWINLDSRLTVGCTGAVLAYLQRRRSTSFLPGDRAAAAMFRITTVEMFSLGGTMFINTDTLLSLQIISTESHPNAQNQGPSSKSMTGGSKEGFSVYGLFHHLAKTGQGRTLLRQYFLRPSQNVKVINERLRSIDIFLRPDNSTALLQLTESLSRVKNMRVVTVNLRKGIVNGVNRTRGVSTSIWPSIREFVFNALRIFDTFAEIQGSEELAIRGKIVEHFNKRQLAAVGQLVSTTVDFEGTKDQRRTIILPGVDHELDEHKRTYEGIEDLLSRVAASIANQVPAELDSKVNVIFFPQIGFLISIRLIEGTAKGIYEGPVDEPWEKMFATDMNAFYKNSMMTEMDNELGDIYARICDREIELAQQLGEQVLEYEQMLNLTSDICGELDCLVALTRGAQLYNLAKPRITHDNIINIKAGRHLLQEQTMPSYVANDTHIVGGYGSDDRLDGLLTQDLTNPGSPEINYQAPEGPSMVLMTGPNYSGKSVYLKQVAIIVYLAHIGSFVPAEAAKIGLIDSILTRIACRESVSRNQSAFMIDLQQISVALNLATRRSLIIIDEFGKGTESYDGAGLAAGTFEHLLQRGLECPKVLGATHFHEIFESGFLAPRPSLSFAHMEVRVESEAGEVNDQITYLYNYRPGRSVSSFGARCAAMNGIDPVIVNRAEKFILLAGDNLVEACAGLTDNELAELQDAENIARDFLEVDIEDDPRALLDELITIASSTVET